MFSNRPIVVSAVGFARMEYSSEFEKMMKSQGYTNPFVLQRHAAKRLFKEIDTKSEPQVPKNVKTLPVDEWILKRDEYIARKVFEEFGWEEVQWDIRTNHLEHLLDELKPCEDPIGQCSLFCKFFPCDK
jgi:hypothetical protein